MSTNLLDAGDIQRLDREKHLTDEAPRQLPQEDRSPDDDDDGLGEFLISLMKDALERRLA